MKLTKKIFEAIDFDAISKMLKSKDSDKAKIEQLRKKHLSKAEMDLKPWELEDDQIKKIYGSSAKEILRIKASKPKQLSKKPSNKTKDSKADDIDMIKQAILGVPKRKQMGSKTVLETDKTKVIIDTDKKEIKIERAYTEDKHFILSTAKNLGYKVK